MSDRGATLRAAWVRNWWTNNKWLGARGAVPEVRNLCDDVDALVAELAAAREEAKQDDERIVRLKEQARYHAGREANLREALRAILAAEWMVTHDWGGDRDALIKQAEAALADGEGEA